MDNLLVKGVEKNEPEIRSRSMGRRHLLGSEGGSVRDEKPPLILRETFWAISNESSPFRMTKPLDRVLEEQAELWRGNTEHEIREFNIFFVDRSKRLFI
jgi:hypothetical protein